MLAEEDPALADEARRDGAVQRAAAAAAGGGAAAANGGPAANGAIGAGRMRVAAAAALVGQNGLQSSRLTSIASQQAPIVLHHCSVRVVLVGQQTPHRSLVVECITGRGGGARQADG